MQCIGNIIIHVWFYGYSLSIMSPELLYFWGNNILHNVWLLVYPSLYRHTEDMIKKLESAGLGFYVRDSQQKLGNIPVFDICVSYFILIAMLSGYICEHKTQQSGILCPR